MPAVCTACIKMQNDNQLLASAVGTHSLSRLLFRYRRQDDTTKGAAKESTMSKWQVLDSRKSDVAENSFETGKKISPIFKVRKKRKTTENSTNPKQKTSSMISQTQKASMFSSRLFHEITSLNFSYKMQHTIASFTDVAMTFKIFKMICWCIGAKMFQNFRRLEKTCDANITSSIRQSSGFRSSLKRRTRVMIEHAAQYGREPRVVRSPAKIVVV